MNTPLLLFALALRVGRLDVSLRLRLTIFCQLSSFARLFVLRHRASEQIITKLRQAEVEIARGQPIAEVCRKLGTSEQTYYRWRKEYGGLRVNYLKRLKTLELENGRLRTVVADQALALVILRETAGNID